MVITLLDLLEQKTEYMEQPSDIEKAIEKKFLTPSKFALEIEKIVSEQKCNYIDAIIFFCDENSLEIESVTKLISKPLKERLRYDAINLNFMKSNSKAKLPI